MATKKRKVPSRSPVDEQFRTKELRTGLRQKDEEKARLLACAEFFGISMASVINMATKEYVRKHGIKVRPLETYKTQYRDPT